MLVQIGIFAGHASRPRIILTERLRKTEFGGETLYGVGLVK